MSSRTTLRPNSVILNGDMSGNLTSQVTILQGITIVSYTYAWAGVLPVGNITVEVCNDYAVGPNGQTVASPGTWIQIPFEVNGSVVTSVPVSGNNGGGFLRLFAPGSYSIRTLYTATSGTGSLTATINGQVS